VWTFPSHDLRAGMEKFQADPERAPFGYVGLAFPSAKDPRAEVKSPGKSTGAFICGDVPWEWFEQWKDTKIHKRGADYEAFKASFKERMMAVLHEYYPSTVGRVEYVELGTPLDTNYYLGRLTGASYGIPPTPSKGKADVEWLRPEIDELPDGIFVCGQDVTVDGFAPACLSALMAMAAIEGPSHWLEVVPMLGGVMRTLEVLRSG
jgi:all-trans-retinol 13,14-reductase